MCFSPQRRAIFQHLNFKKWSGADVLCTFSLQNVLLATAQFFNISTSKSGPELMCFVSHSALEVLAAGPLTWSTMAFSLARPQIAWTTLTPGPSTGHLVTSFVMTSQVCKITSPKPMPSSPLLVPHSSNASPTLSSLVMDTLPPYSSPPFGVSPRVTLPSASKVSLAPLYL